MNKNVFFSILSGLALCFTSPTLASDSKPMSAIDWLAEKITDPPDFYTYPNEEQTVGPKQDRNKIEVNQLPGISKNSIGIFGGIRIGLPVNVWSDETETILANEIKKISNSELFRLNRFLKKVLLIEADPPIIDQNSKYPGKLFLRTRISKLIKMGALDDAEELLRSANPAGDPTLLDLWAEITFLTGRLDEFCTAILTTHDKDMFHAYRVICLARSGDWNAAALALATYSSMGKIQENLESLLINYLDHEAALNIKNQDLCLKEVPVLVYLCRFSGIQLPSTSLPLEYLYSDLSRSKSLRARLNASEEFVKGGALNPNFLFANYKIKQASTSGGVWARVRLIQELDKDFNSPQISLQDLLNKLLNTVQEFNSRGLLPQFAYVYGQKIEKIELNKIPLELREKIIALLLLSRKSVSYSQVVTIRNLSIVSAIQIANSNIGWTETEKLPNLLQENQITLLQKVVLEASLGKFPEERKSTSEILQLLTQERTGVVLLKAFSLISSGHKSDLLDLQIGLAALVRLGLLEEFKNIASEVLILDYFQKTLERS